VEWEELYAERLRREAQAKALAAGEIGLTDQLDRDARIKLSLAWSDATSGLGHRELEYLQSAITHTSMRSHAVDLAPKDMQLQSGRSNENLLSLIEAEHAALKRFVEASSPFGHTYPTGGAWGTAIIDPAEHFRKDVNRIFGTHLVGFALHSNSQLMPVHSHEMHSAVVAPTLYLLHSQTRFAAAETAYQKALAELRDGDAGDAITDAATALQDALSALGCTGGALGDLLSSAKKNGLVKGNDTPLTDAISRTVSWVAARRNQGEAHRGDPDIDMSDAWMVVHVVGALIIRLAEQDN
jgi:hypothetical protein